MAQVIDKMKIAISIITLLVTVGAVLSLPTVDPGLFVISGVQTCGDGRGYCLLGSDCTMNQDFASDPGGHCGGLRGAFTPSAHFVCCTASTKVKVELTTTTEEVTTLQADKNITTTTSAPMTTLFPNENETVHQTITSPPDYIPADSDPYGDESENTIDWGGVKNITEVTESCPHCSPQTVFILQTSPLCLGTHLRDGWVLTSGSCALKVFRAGMVKVIGKYQQDPTLEASVKTIAVHEDYRPYSSNILHPEPNNIGLILLSSEPQNACKPCIPGKEDKFAGKLCATVTNASLLATKIVKNDPMVTDDICESVVETMQGDGTEDFYTVACDSNSDSRYNGEDSSESGKGLLCRGFVAGIETGSGTGLAVFTRVSLYTDWIMENMVQEQRQEFFTSL